jgi:hypothetical protein
MIWYDTPMFGQQIIKRPKPIIAVAVTSFYPQLCEHHLLLKCFPAVSVFLYQAGINNLMMSPVVKSDTRYPLQSSNSCLTCGFIRSDQKWSPKMAMVNHFHGGKWTWSDTKHGLFHGFYICFLDICWFYMVFPSICSAHPWWLLVITSWFPV